MRNSNKAASENDVERQSSGTEARGFIAATKDVWPKDIEIMEETAINGQRIALHRAGAHLEKWRDAVVLNRLFQLRQPRRLARLPLQPR